VHFHSQFSSAANIAAKTSSVVDFIFKLLNGRLNHQNYSGYQVPGGSRGVVNNLTL
jgi:hypothetical protein